MRFSVLEFLCIGVLSLLLVACSQKEDGQQSVTETNSQTESKTLESGPTILARGEVRNIGNGASDDFILFAPMMSGTTYLIDTKANVKKQWQSDSNNSLWVYLRDNGHLLRGTAAEDVSAFSTSIVTGQNGVIQEYDWDGNLVWDYTLNDGTYLAHHDIELLPNGNILLIAWEKKSVEDAKAAGRSEELIAENGLWSDAVFEIEPVYPNGGNVVWEWHAWDHLIQNKDAALANFGEPSGKAERIDINGDRIALKQFVPPKNIEDFFHINSIDYNAEFDQILLSVPHYNEIWIIDHSTTTIEAATSSGGKYGKGGDLLYRWGNPAAYGQGDESQRQLGFQHDVQWIADGYPGAGNILIFNNQPPGLLEEAPPQPEGIDPSFVRGSQFSAQILEIKPPVTNDGNYAKPDAKFEPEQPLWTYQDPGNFIAQLMSGAARLKNGNTLITRGPFGKLFEVNQKGEMVWEYLSPYSNEMNRLFIIYKATSIPKDYPGLQGKF